MSEAETKAIIEYMYENHPEEMQSLIDSLVKTTNHLVDIFSDPKLIEKIGIEAIKNQKALGDELRKIRESIKDENVLIGFNMAIAICNKYLGEGENRNENN